MNINATKKTILNAAISVLLEIGASGFTLEAVAKAAGLSKGGLLYHFATKDDILRALIEYQIEFFNSLIEKNFDNSCKHPHSRAYIEACFDEQNKEGDQIAAAVIGIVANNLDLIIPLTQAYQQWREYMFLDGIQESLIDTIILCLDGLWLQNITNRRHLIEDKRIGLKTELIRILEADV